MSEGPVCVARHVNHVALVVNDMDETLEFYRRTFGVGSAETEEVPDQGVRAAVVRIGGTLLELIEPTDPSSGVARYIERRGEGMHHICFEVDNLEDTLSRLDDADVQLVDKTPRKGLVGNIAFLHPRSTRGVLIELVDADGAKR
jgi:methylmalonyl-CoA/ethylmalonyl-CoA epimerase